MNGYATMLWLSVRACKGQRDGRPLGWIWGSKRALGDGALPASQGHTGASSTPSLLGHGGHLEFLTSPGIVANQNNVAASPASQPARFCNQIHYKCIKYSTQFPADTGTHSHFLPSHYPLRIARAATSGGTVAYFKPVLSRVFLHPLPLGFFFPLTNVFENPLSNDF